MMQQTNQRSSNGHRQFDPSQSAETHTTLEQSKEIISDYPISSLMVVFGLGVGLGVLLSQSLVAPMLQPQCATERLGKQIYDAIASGIPDSIMRKMHV